MIPNDFGIIRQADRNLFALLFPPLTDISEYECEIIMPEYIDESYYYSNGTLENNILYSHADVDCTKYDYILAPTSSVGVNAVSGLRAAPGTGAVTERAQVFSTNANSYSLFIIGDRKFLAISVLTNFKLPVIGFRRHRSDGANPLGIIQPLDPGALEPDDPVPDPEDQEER